MLRSWGGVTVAYRKRMVDSPAYRLNHEEIIKALEEGISFTENVNPIEAVAQWRAGSLRPLCVFDDTRMPYKEKVTDKQSWADIPTCKDLIDRIMAEANAIINKRLPGFANA